MYETVWTITYLITSFFYEGMMPIICIKIKIFNNFEGKNFTSVNILLVGVETLCVRTDRLDVIVWRDLNCLVARYYY